MASCSLESVKSIALESGFKNEWDLNEDLDKAVLKIQAIMDSGSVQELTGATSGVTITGFDTSTPGEKTMIIQYEGVSVSIDYIVIADENVARTGAQLLTMIEKGVSTITLLPGDTYDLGKKAVVNSCSIRTYGAATNEKAIIAGLVVDYSNVAAQSISFTNVKLSNVGYNGASESVVTVTGGADAKDGTVAAVDHISFNKCDFEAEGQVTNGVNISKKISYAFTNCSFVTPGEDDVFVNIVQQSNITYYSSTDNVFNGNNFTCRFAYGVQGICGASFISNTINDTLTYEEHFLDGAQANLVNYKKNPVFFHTNTQGNGGKMDLIIVDNTISNLENLFRFYHTDDSDVAVADDLVFTNNTLENINVVARYSTAAYGKDIVNYILTSNATMKNGQPISTAYTLANDLVLAQNTAVYLDGTMTINQITTDAASLTVYGGFKYQEKYTEDEAHRYNYVAKINSINGSTKLGGYILQKGDKFYRLTIAYSADGKDSRVLEEITDTTVLGVLNTYIA